MFRYKVTQTIHPRKLVHHPHFLRIALLIPQFPQPRKLKQLLREEESSDEVRLGRKRREIPFMNIEHVGAAKHAILLCSEVEQE